MFTFFTYKTPARFADSFKQFYASANVRQVKVLSATLFSIAFLSRAMGIIYYQQVVTINNYNEHSLNNWIQLAGAFCFYILSNHALYTLKWTDRNKRALTLAFILFVLMISFGTSYIISLHNTKNTLTMFLVGIVTVSLFFAIEYREIIAICACIVIVFIVGMVLPKIAFNDRIVNVVAAFILGFILLCFSRYSYYFKSQHFVRLKELEEKNLEIEHLVAQKIEILGFVAHDLRNPLNNIEALSGLLLAEDQSNEEAKLIGKSAIQAKEIINDLIEGVKLHQPILQTKRTELTAYLKTIIKKWRLNSNREISLNSDAEQYAFINASKLERVIDNLISNGLKFSAADTPIVINVFAQEQQLYIQVIDYGIGIPMYLQDFIFNQFSKAGRMGLLGEKSIGLGLHISKKIIEQHHGQLLVHSLEHKGTTFTIKLPLA